MWCRVNVFIASAFNCSAGQAGTGIVALQNGATLNVLKGSDTTYLQCAFSGPEANGGEAINIASSRTLINLVNTNHSSIPVTSIEEIDAQFSSTTLFVFVGSLWLRSRTFFVNSVVAESGPAGGSGSAGMVVIANEVFFVEQNTIATSNIRNLFVDRNCY